MIRTKLLATISAISFWGFANAQQDTTRNYSYVNMYKTEVLSNSTNDTLTAIIQRKKQIAIALAKKQPIF